MEKKDPKYIRGKYTEAQNESTKKWQKKAYDDHRLRLKKGQKAILQEIAAAHNMSLNGFIVAAIYNYVEQLEKEYEESQNTNE